MSAKMLSAYRTVSGMTRTAVKRVLLAVFLTAAVAAALATTVVIAIFKIA